MYYIDQQAWSSTENAILIGPAMSLSFDPYQDHQASNVCTEKPCCIEYR
jgi:hypothetical protein